MNYNHLRGRLPALAAFVLLLPVAGWAANVCVWNYDTGDRFYDAEVGDSVSCSYWVAQELTSLGHNAEVFDTYLPGNLSSYDAVFCLMGWYRC